MIKKPKMRESSFHDMLIYCMATYQPSEKMRGTIPENMNFDEAYPKPCNWPAWQQEVVRAIALACHLNAGGVLPGKQYKFEVEHPGEMAAGIIGFTDTITITVESGDPGGDKAGKDSFQEYMLQAIREWYDGAGVGLSS